MSLILEALRKSEAERRRGQVPDLHAEPSPGAQPARDGPSMWLWLALALAAAIVLSLAMWFARSMFASPPNAVVASESDAAAIVASNDIPRDADGGALAIAAPLEVRDPPAMDPQPRPDRQPVEAPPVRAPASANVLPSRPDPVRPTTAPVAAIAIPASASSRLNAATAAPPPAATPGAPAVVALTTATAPAGASLLRLADLGVEQRRQLPPLKMSMHMWAPDQRFAIIDGARVAEGDRIGDAVVEEITATGVVLAWQGQRLQIPVR